MSELAIVVADKDIEATLQGLLLQPRRLRIRAFEYKILVHTNRDPGCYNQPHAIVNPRLYSKVLVVFDRHGSGHDDDRGTVEENVVETLALNGWARGKTAAVAIEPEIEQWVWSDSPHVAEVLGWRKEDGDLRTWLIDTGAWGDAAQPKPRDPKHAMEQVLRKSGKRPSASLFLKLAQRVSVERCTDPAFTKLKDTLSRWFPPLEPTGP